MPLRGSKLPAFKYRHIGATMQISEISGLSIAMLPRLHQSNIGIKRSFKESEHKNIIFGLVQTKGTNLYGAANYPHSSIAI